jgi:lipopolysaccharide export system protein LptA
MLLRSLTILAGLMAAAGAEPRPEAAKDRPFGVGELGRSKEPITVTADTLEYDYKANVVVYRGTVQATQGNVKLRSDTLTVTFTARPAAGPAGSDETAPAPLDPDARAARVQEIVATGGVRIDQGTRWATGGKAVFDQAQRTLVLTDEPVLHDGPNEVVGDRVVVYLDEDRSVVEGGRKRVKAVLYPDREDGAASAPRRAARP